MAISWLIILLFFRLTWLFYGLSLGLLYATITFRKRFNGTRVLKFYFICFIIILTGTQNIPKYLTDGINNELNPCSLIHPYSDDVIGLRDKILNKTDEIYDASDINRIAEYVINHTEYTYDLFNWGLMEYWPTPEETLSKGKEDCDGMAILTCSILRSMNIDAYVVVGTDHLWVQVYNCSGSDFPILTPRPPELFMFNEHDIIYFKTNIEMHYYELFPVYTTVFISDEKMLIVPALGMYGILFVAYVPNEDKFEGKKLSIKNFMKWAKKRELFKISNHYRMAKQSLLTFLVFALICLTYPQLSLISLIIIASLNIIAVDRRNERMAKVLIEFLLILGFTLLCLNYVIPGVNAISSLGVT